MGGEGSGEKSMYIFKILAIMANRNRAVIEGECVIKKVKQNYKDMKK